MTLVADDFMALYYIYYCWRDNALWAVDYVLIACRTPAQTYTFKTCLSAKGLLLGFLASVIKNKVVCSLGHGRLKGWNTCRYLISKDRLQQVKCLSIDLHLSQRLRSLFNAEVIKFCSCKGERHVSTARITWKIIHFCRTRTILLCT